MKKLVLLIKIKVLFSVLKNTILLIDLKIPILPALMIACVFFLSKNNVFAQSEVEYLNMYSINPHSWEFHKMEHFTPDLYQGTINVQIPLYEIKLNGINIPIGISYNTKGIKLQNTASRVGQNWQLHAGGVITRSVRGKFYDFEEHAFDVGQGSQEQTTYLHYGWQNHENEWQDNTSNEHYDTEPDVFYLTAPGLASVFMIDKGNNAFVLSGDDIVIDIEIEEFQIEGGTYGIITVPDREKEDIKTIIVKSKQNGNRYYFNEPEWLTVYNPGPQKSIQNWHLTKIVTTYGDVIRFNYDDISAQHLIINTIHTGLKMPKNFYGNQLLFETDGWTNTIHMPLNSIKFLKDISFPGGNVDFSYNHSREDIPYDKALSEVIVTNYTDNVVSNYEFHYSYFKYNGEKTRLKLDKIDIKDNLDDHVSSFILDYNQGSLPGYKSYQYDFLGYYNGRGADNDRSKIYAYIGNTVAKTMYLPVYFDHWNWPSEDLVVFDFSYENGDEGGDRMPSASFSNIGMLNSIVYPTGGSKKIIYEINKAQYGYNGPDGPDGPGGYRFPLADYPGLRVKKQIIYNKAPTYTETYEHSYEYIDSYGLTPVFGLLTVHSDVLEKDSNPTQTERRKFIKDYSVLFFQNQLNFDLFKGYSIVYPVVKEKIQNKGSITYVFDSPKDKEPELVFIPYNQHQQSESDYDVFFDSPSKFPFFSGESNQARRGFLREKWYLNNDDKFVKAELFKYVFLPYSQEILFSSKSKRKIIRDYSPKVGASNRNFSGKNVLTKKYTVYFDENDDLNGDRIIGFPDVCVFEAIDNESVYLSGVTAKEKKLINYNTNKYPSLIKELGSNGEWVETHYTYYNFPGASYIKGIPQIVYSKKNNKIIEGRKFEYEKSGNIIRIQKEWRAKSKLESLVFELDISFDSYGSKANIQQYTENGDFIVSYIWGYNENYPIAKIENATYDEVVSNLGCSIDELQFMSDDGLINIFKDLRNNLSNANITSYTYKPLIGVTSITDPRGQDAYFEYDPMGRLKRTLDYQGKIIEEHEYNYAKDEEDEGLYRLTVLAGEGFGDGQDEYELEVEVESTTLSLVDSKWVFSYEYTINSNNQQELLAVSISYSDKEDGEYTHLENIDVTTGIESPFSGEISFEEIDGELFIKKSILSGTP